MLTQSDVNGREDMTKTKIRAFLEEFPWVKSIDVSIGSAYVSIMEPSMLAYRGGSVQHGMDSDEGNVVYIEDIFLIRKNGQFLVRERTTSRKKFWIFGERISSVKEEDVKVNSGDLVESVFEKLTVNELNEVGFLLSVGMWKKVYRPLHGINSEWSPARVIVYKLPTEKLGNWLYGQFDLERKGFKKEFASL